MLGPQSERKNAVEPSFDHPPWRHPYAREARWMPLSITACSVVRVKLRVLSLLVEEGICLPLEVWQESWPIFKGLPKVGEVSTNH